MRTFTVTCPDCDVDYDVQISEADILDADLTHVVACETCGQEMDFEYDAETQDLIPVADDEDGDGDEDEDEDDEPEETDAAEEGEDEK